MNFAFILPAQDTGIEKALTDYVAKYPQEKAYIVTDRSTYIAGEDIWFAAHLVDATTHQPTKISTILYVDLVDKKTGNVILRRNIEITDGLGEGDFIAPYDVQSGTYDLVAFTSYMRNFDSDFFFKKYCI